jgi:hypothetical protein
VKEIASVGCDMPIALLAATGRYAGPLGYDAGRPTPRAREWLESTFAPWAFQILEDWASGALDHLEMVVFSRGDDSAQRLYYYVCELRRTGSIAGPEPIMLDVAHVPRASSLAHTIASVRKLAGRLGVAEESVRFATGPAKAPLPSGRNGPACLIEGTLPPDRRLHEVVEACGWTAIGDTLPENWSASAPFDDAEAGDAFERLGQHIHLAAAGPRSFGDRVAALRARIAETKAAAVLLWFCEHDEVGAWQARPMRLALEAANVPHLLMVRRDWLAGDGAAVEISDFLAGVRP